MATEGSFAGTAWRIGVAMLAFASLVAGCQPPALHGGGDALAPTFALQRSDQILAHPQHFDWFTQRVSSPHISRQRDAYVHALAAQANPAMRNLLAWPSGSSGWVPSTTYPGVSLTALGAAAGDTVPNGPCSTYIGGTVPASIMNKVFFLTKNGLFIKADKPNPTGASAKLQLGSGKTFSRTYVSLSPSCSHAYCLADDGTCYIIDTVGMTLRGTVSVAGGYGIAPTLDPFTSNAEDLNDSVWIPDNGGTVHSYTVSSAGPGTPVTITTGATYPVATGITPLSGATTYVPATTYNAGNYKVAAPAIVLGGVIYQGDEAGNLQVYDTTNTANNITYAVGNAGIESAPALEIQDGSYTGLTDPFGNPITVANNTPIYAFVNAGTKNGPMCAWVNLVNQSISWSLPTYFDDNDKGRKADYVLNYNYKITKQTSYLVAQDGGAIAMDGSNIPTFNQPWENSVVGAAETNLTAPSAGKTFGSANSPTGIVYDTSGHLWVTFPGPNEVIEYDTAGNVLATFTNANGISKPMGIAVDSTTGNIWVANQNGNSVSVITPGGAITTYSTGLGLNQPTGIAVDASSNVWVTNQAGNNVTEVSSAGALVRTVTVGTKPVAVAVDLASGNVWVANNGSNNVTKFSSTGTVAGTYSSGGNQPMAIAIDSLGNAWVADFGGNTVVELKASGGSAMCSVTIGQPQGVAIDGADNVWVTSKNNNNVVEIASCAIVNTLVTGNAPYGVDVGPAGTAVADTGSNQVTITNAPGGGPIYGYLRFTDPNSATYPAGSSIQAATLSLTTFAGASQSCYVPEIWSTGTFGASGSTGVYYKGTTTLWSGNGGLNASNAPALTSAAGVWVGGGINGQGIVNFGGSKQYSWDVTPAVGGHIPVQYYGLAMKFDPASAGTAPTYPTKGNTVYCPNGPLAANQKGNKSPFYAPTFQNYNNGVTGAGSKSDSRPLLTLQIGVATSVATGPVETPPIIDSLNHKVYVEGSNYLYCFDYTDTTHWADVGPAGTMYSTFNTCYWGTNGGATTNTQNYFVQNTTAPLLSYDGSAIYLYNDYPQNANNAPPYANWNAAVTKILLPLSPGTDRQSPNTGAPGTKVPNTMTNSGVNGGLLTNSAASSYMVLDPFVNQTSTGGGVYLGLVGTGMIYQFDP